MFEKENIILKNINKNIEALGKSVDRFAVAFDKKLNRLEENVDAKMLLLDEKMIALGKRVDERMDLFEESNRKNGALLEKLKSKFDLSIEGYSSLKELSEKMNERLNVLEGRA